MSTPYNNLLRQIAYHCGALRGDATVSIETSYLVTPLTKAELRDDTPFNFTALTDALLQAEQDFCWAVASTGNHPWRVNIRGVTAALADKAVLPAIDSNSKGIIGNWGAIYDSSDLTTLVEMPIDMIVRRMRNANTHYVCPVYYYKIDGSIIRHTRTAVIIEVCIYDRATQAAAIASNGNMLLPDVIASALVATAAGSLMKSNDGDMFRATAAAALQAIQQGLISVVAKSVPVPVTQKRAG